MEFEAASVVCDSNYEPPVTGRRRALVEQYYRTLDFRKSGDIRRLLQAYENILNTAERKVPDSLNPARARRALVDLITCLKKDGFGYRNGRVIPVTPSTRSVLGQGGEGHTISEVTRRSIFDALRIRQIAWWGRLSEVEFLSRIYDLESLPSSDPRFASAHGDVCQHRETNPDDWPDDWLFTDTRFGLLNATDDGFLLFLCEMVHPVVRPDTDSALEIVGLFNEHLSTDGWEIVSTTQISGKPVFAARRRVVEMAMAFAAVRTVTAALNADYVNQQITRMQSAVESDPELAIGTAKEFVETIGNTILAECGESVPGGVDLPQLLRLVRKRLQLLPNDIPERARGAETIRRLLSNLGTVVQGLAELRGLYGSGHGKSAKSKGLQPRHARLAVGAATTLGIFLFETYQRVKEST